MRVYRLHRNQRRASDYDGSLVRPGRWNTSGTPVLYCSSGLALATLEMLVHLEKQQIPDNYVYSYTQLPDMAKPGLIDYRGALQDQESTRRRGQSWLVHGGTLAVCVPSVIIPIENNVLLNPVHDLYQQLSWSEPEPFHFDPRLFSTSQAQ
jgi:RES domain-containing protein